MLANDLTHVYVPFADVIKATVKGADGAELPARIVRGIMTEEKLDLDEQIVDYDWAKGASAKWWNYANIREQHTSKGVGKGREIEYDDANRRITLTSKIVDGDAIMKIDEGVYSGYSIGIKGAGIVKDAAAPNGRINRGNQVECSIVDHPSLETAKFAVVKMRKDGEPELGAGIEPLTDDDAKLFKIAGAEETKLADITAEKSILDHLAADIDGLNKPDTIPASPQTAAEPGSGIGSQLDVTPESALPRRKKKRLPDAKTTTTPKAGEADAAKGVTTITITSDDNVDVSEDEEGDDDTAVSSPLEATTVNPQAARVETALDHDLGGSLKSTTTKPEITRSEEDIDMLYAKAVPQLKDLLIKGDTAAALALIAATELLTKTAAPASAAAPAVATPVVEPATEPAAAQPPASTTDNKSASPDTLKATISEAVNKAVESAFAPLKEKVEAMEKRAAPGGPLLSGTRLLSAPDQIKGQFLKARIEDIKKMAEEHPDGSMRQGARELLAELEKNA